MKKTPSPPPVIRCGQIRKPSSNFQLSPTSNNGNKQNQKTRPAFNYIKVAAQKVAGVFTFFFLWQWKTNSQGDKPDSNQQHSQLRGTSLSIDNSKGSNSKTSSRSKYGTAIEAASGEAGNVDLSIEEIHKATGNFSPANKIGEGGFATVYKGKLKNGSLVAIKRAKKEMYNNRLSTEFKNEIVTLSKIEHLNLVRLFGYVEHREERIIVVEYVGNGTLREHLDGTHGNALEIGERLDIAIDVAHAVTYLHTYTDPPIIHRDIKASNILITEKLHAKVADFGFARIAVEDPGATHISTQVKGTAGYLDPEYLTTSQLSPKSDVYSFGVLLVEMMTGRHPIESERSLNERITTSWAMQKLKEGYAILAMDPILRRSPASNLAVERVLKLARRCVAPTRQSRPSMKKCAEVLWRIRKDFMEKSFSHAASTSSHSANILERDGRKDRHNMFGIEDSENYRFLSA